MGGTLAVTLRTEDKDYRMLRWTNPVPGFINHPGLVSKDPKHVAQYMKSWFEMQDYWLENRDTEEYKLHMTSCYEPFPAPLAPAGYGLVVIDFRTNKILSHQGYSTPGRVHTSPNLVHNGMTNQEDIDWEINRICWFFTQGRVRDLRVQDEDWEHWRDDLPPPRGTI